MVERRPGPLAIGQADGVQTRTVEIFDSFGIAEELLRDAYHVLEVAFWSPSFPSEGKAEGGIRRSRYTPDKETALSHQPHVILNQARINGLMISQLDREICYSTEVTGISISQPEPAGGHIHSHSQGDGQREEYPVTVTTQTPSGTKTYRAKYALASDGAHSTVRKSLGIAMVGDSTDSIWGVMDVYPRTSFPDIRKKAVITSAHAGSILLIPREGDAMVRFYIELATSTKASEVTLEDLQSRTRAVFAPYEIEFASTAWWSAYAIGQRHANAFDVAGRVFLMGDACHTHSPKAGQGMNVSLQDGYNIGWKLGMVLSGRADPKLLQTYVTERERTAVDLIEFDRAFAKLFSSAYREEHGITPEYFAEQFVKAGRYTAGQAVQYSPSVVVAAAAAAAESTLAEKVTVGMRFPSAQVVRFCDAKAIQLVKGMPADGQWFVVVFAGDLADEETAKRLQVVGFIMFSEQQERLQTNKHTGGGKTGRDGKTVHSPRT